MARGAWSPGVASYMQEGPASSLGPVGMAGREDVGRKSLALLLSVKPAQTPYEVMAQTECCQTDSSSWRVSSPSLQPHTSLFSTCLQTRTLPGSFQQGYVVCGQVLLSLNGQREDQRGEVTCLRTRRGKRTCLGLNDFLVPCPKLIMSSASTLQQKCTPSLEEECKMLLNISLPGSRNTF